jgi:hypothetical protein
MERNIMKDTIELKIEVTVKGLNQFLALSGEDVITTDEELAKYDGLTLKPEELPESEMVMAVNCLPFIAKTIASSAT